MVGCLQLRSILEQFKINSGIVDIYEIVRNDTILQKMVTSHFILFVIHNKALLIGHIMTQ